VLTAENAALRLQIAQQAQTLQSDAREQVSVVSLLHTQMQLSCLICVLHHVSWNLYLRICSCCRNDHGTVHITACATQQRPKQPAACMLYHVRLCNVLSLHVRHTCALLLVLRLTCTMLKKYTCRQKKSPGSSYSMYWMMRSKTSQLRASTVPRRQRQARANRGAYRLLCIKVPTGVQRTCAISEKSCA